LSTILRLPCAELDEQTRERMIIGEELRHAIARGEFELFYQPQVDLKSGSIVGQEALIRWNHPTRGPLLPAAFIPSPRPPAASCRSANG
jgi:sensor c-di-GMP phosphodiesterase-like protein